ncbi:Uncharacterized protein DBV15_11231 [Temnothorax longispinosus]|uniref:Uncharacterized protein n=1 Tax=Temnothorax longispinosus TaxID=300112 RepID=A0A4S2KNL3_9HYME|nr:Uncharacterized protein DBV15_11231 [Temnothorax longispinosus]
MDNPEYPDNSVEVNLQDVITGEEFTLQLSPNSALKAKTGKRKATDQPAIIQTLIEKRQKAEEEKAKRHKERMEMGNKMLAKLDKLLEKK